MPEGNVNGDAQRALDEIRELRRLQGEATKEQTAALNAINTKLGHIEGMVGGQAEGNAGRDRRIAESERRLERQDAEIAALKLDVGTAKASGAPLQKLGYVIITSIVLGFGGLIATSMLRPQAPPQITVQMPASTAP